MGHKEVSPKYFKPEFILFVRFNFLIRNGIDPVKS